MKGLLVSLLLTGLCQAVKVYLHPSPDAPSRLSLNQAGAVLSRHLNLDRFEDTTAYPGEQELIIGEGPKTGLLLTLSKEHAKDIIPSSLKSTFHLKSHPSRESLESLIPSYISRAHHVYSYVYETHDQASTIEKSKRVLDAFSVPGKGSEEAIEQLYSLMNFVDGENLPTDRFGAFDLTHLEDLRHTFGKDSEQYRTAVQTVKVILDRLLERNDTNLALVAVPSHAGKHHKRQQPPQSPLPPPLPHPAEPIDSISTCYSNADVCGNATNACSGHGQCVEATKAGKTCFVCACSATTDEKGRKEQWAGSACERKDVSGPFVLLAGTTVTLLLLVGGSIALLTAVGDQKLPSTLTGGVASNTH